MTRHYTLLHNCTLVKTELEYHYRISYKISLHTIQFHEIKNNEIKNNKSHVFQLLENVKNFSNTCEARVWEQ